jgi:hypothetical protein
VELMAQGLFANHELGGICPIKAVDTISPRYSILHFRWRRPVVPILKVPGLFQYLIRD